MNVSGVTNFETEISYSYIRKFLILKLCTKFKNFPHAGFLDKDSAKDVVFHILRKR